MKSSDQTRYRERTSWPGIAYAVLWGAVVVSCYPILAGWDGDLPDALRWPMVVGIAALVAGLTWVVGGLTVVLRQSGILVHLGSVPLIRTFIPYAEIRSLRSVEYRPVREFGGWGVRGTRRRRAWTARGHRAVLLQLHDGREVLVGSDHPQRLEERIRTVAGLKRWVVGPGEGRPDETHRDEAERDGAELEGDDRPESRSGGR